MNKTVIAFFGESGSGKSTACEELMEQASRGVGFENVNYGETFNFADKLKEVVHLSFGVPKEILWGTKEQKDTYIHEASGKTVRFLMQWVGETFRQGPGGQTIWVDRVIKDVVESSAEFICIGDGRHPEFELVYFKEQLARQGIPVYGIRILPDYRGYKGLQGAEGGHPSESLVARSALSIYDSVIDNSGVVDDLTREAVVLGLEIAAGKAPSMRAEWRL